jgi:uncharacterized repeat protein (TIGR01451 family)
MKEKVSNQANAWRIVIAGFVSLSLIIVSAWATPSLDLVKNATVDTPGGTIHEGTILTSAYTITNTGNETINNIVITDVRNYPTPGFNATIPSSEDLGSLQAGKSITINDAYTVTEDDICAQGILRGTATAKGKDSVGCDVVSDTSETVTPVQTSASIILQIEPISHPLALAHPGDEVEFKYTVENPAYNESIYRCPTSVHGLVVVDTLLGKVSMNKTDLKPGESATGTKKYTVLADKKTFSSGVTADADSCKLHVLVGADSNLRIINPDMTIVATSDKASVKSNDTLNFTITITNTGDCTLSDIVVVDTLPKGLSFVDDDQSEPKPVPNPPLVNSDGTTTLTYTKTQLAKSGVFKIDIAIRSNGQANGRLRNSVQANATDLLNTIIGPKVASKDVTV